VRSLADYIEEQIKNMLKEAEDNVIQLQRRMLADRFGCVPSQINYVLKTRFTPERGYVVDSQRGGHGFIRIVKVDVYVGRTLADYVDKAIGYGIDPERAKEIISMLAREGYISLRERFLLEHAFGIIWELINMLDVDDKEGVFARQVSRLLTPFVKGEVRGDSDDVSDMSSERGYHSYNEDSQW